MVRTAGWRPAALGAALLILLAVSPTLAAERMLYVSDGAAAIIAAPPREAADPPAVLPQATAAPTRVPTATPAPSPTSAPAARLPLWGQNAEAVTLWSGADPDADSYTSVPPGAYFKILSATDSRYQVYYGGDRVRRRPGEAWVDKPSLTAAEWPKFVRVGEAGVLRAGPQASARAAGTLPRGAYLEVLGQRDDWTWLLYLGDGRDSGPLTGWLPSAMLVPTDVDPARIGRFLATAETLRRQPEVWLKVPYVSQLDGSPWALANCGPTSLAMMLGAHGLSGTSGDVRRQVMALQGTPNCNDCGSFIEALAGAAEVYGLRPMDLRTPDGNLRRWSTDDMRSALRASRPVLPQVKFRLLPGREDSAYGGDHYIVLTGLAGDAFLYNDPIDDGPAYGRVISAEQLRRAMGASDFPYAAFSTTLP